MVIAMLKGFTRKFKPFEILSEEDVQEIHKATLDVLRQTGLRFESDWALGFFKKNGCDVDFEEKRVRFPEGLVEESLRKCPSSFRMRARDPKKDLVYGGNNLYFANFPAMQTIDLDTFEPRPATKAEYIDYVKILDALPNLHEVSTTPYCGFQGVPPVMEMIEGLAIKLSYSSKLQQTGYSNDCEIFKIQMAQAVGAEIKGVLAAAPPLTWTDDAVLHARRMIEAGFPLVTSDGSSFGASAPATYAGSVITSNAQHIGMIVLVQLLHPGHRIHVIHYAFPQDMRSGSPGFGQIGCSISNVIFNQMWRKYGVPVINASPGPIASKSIDYQSGYEKALGGIIAAVSGAHRITLHGCVSAELAAHPVQAILDDDVAGMIGRFVEGEEINDETLAVELIQEVGPIPGNYLGKAHTRKWWKIEQFLPKAADTLTYPEWVRSGKKRAIDYAKERMEEILATHKPMPLTSTQEQAIQDILREARDYYRKKGLISGEEWAVYMKSLS
jgi:trimethylamine--corrinoid protein Co-methyltransferase